MLRISLLSTLLALLIISCYPLGTFQGPEVLPVGEETAGVGVSWMTNMVSLTDSSSGNEQAFIADASLLLRRGFPNNTEIGIKFVGLPWSGGAVFTDAKWQVLKKPLLVSLDFGLSYWNNIDILASVGYHPALIAGNEKFYTVFQTNYIRSSARFLRTQDLLLGHHIFLKDSDYTFTPQFGLHRDLADPENLFYSLGFGFAGPVDGWKRF